MSKVKKTVAVKETKGPKGSPFQMYWTKGNFIIFGIGLLVIITGYLFMASNPWDGFLSLNVSPIVLLLGYLVIFPLSILFSKKKS